MATTLTTGAVTTAQSPANRQVLDMADKIYLLEPQTIVVALFSRTGLI